jgi:hypothetical protein
VISDSQAKADLLAEFTRRNGARAARGLMLGLPSNRPASRSELLTAASKTTITRFTLEPGQVDRAARQEPATATDRRQVACQVRPRSRR